ncbi:MAG: HPF/RaiA family ribosome-associated protein [Treponema sp.]|nr:HPF/RaiA family ribosome-associated protein [Treponema sp.]
MNKSVNAVGFELEKKQAEMLDKKLERFDYAEKHVEDLIIRVKQDKQYKFEADVAFHWGVKAHVTADDFDFAAGLNKLVDVLDQKIKKEKEKVQEK